MIRINLLGKKKTASPFGLDERLEKLGVSIDDFHELRPALIRVACVVRGLYVANWVPNYLHQREMERLDIKLQGLTAKSAELQRQLTLKKDIRKQMEQLNKEESELQRQLNAVSALQRDRSAAFIALNDLSIILEKIQKVWIDDVKYDKKDASKFTLTGRSWEYFPINDFVKAISESSRYTGVQFKEIAAEEAKKVIPGVPEAMQKVKKFTLEYLVKDLGE